jgi:hypothetical protein
MSKEPRRIQLTFSTTEAISEELRIWAEVAGWSLSKTIHVIVLEGMSAYDRPRFPLVVKGDSKREKEGPPEP